MNFTTAETPSFANVCAAAVPQEIFDPQLDSLVERAILRIENRLTQFAPFVSSDVTNWIASQSVTARAADCFRDLRAHIVLFPWFIENAVPSAPDLAFHGDVVYSSVNAYYYVRLLDNVMDGHASGEISLLPMLSFFHSEFQSVWERYFPPTHEFWDFFRSVWFGMAEATVRSTRVTDYSSQDFVEISVRKISGIKIPMAAVCMHQRRPDALPGWLRVFDAYAGFNETLDGLFDWQQDLALGTGTYLIAEAMRRKAPGESPSSWLVREGIQRGYTSAQGWILEAQIAARELDCPRLLEFLEFRLSQVEVLWKLLLPELARLSQLAKALQTDDATIP